MTSIEQGEVWASGLQPTPAAGEGARVVELTEEEIHEKIQRALDGVGLTREQLRRFVKDDGYYARCVTAWDTVQTYEWLLTGTRTEV